MELELDKAYCMDCLELMRQMDDKSVDLTITQPPAYDGRKYNGKPFSVKLIAESLYRVTKDGGVVVWITTDKTVDGFKTLKSFQEANHFQKAGFNVHDIMIYRKKNPPFAREDGYTNAFEYMFIFSKGTPKTFNPLKERMVGSANELESWVDDTQDKIKTNIWEYAVGYNGSTTDREAFRHPSIFPENLAMDHIMSWSNSNDLVFDPMCGSGTTLKMAALSGRRFLGADINQEYIDITNSRLGIFAK